MTARASTISRILNNANVPSWSYETRQLKTTAILSVNQDTAQDAKAKKEIEELLVFAGYQLHLNGSRHYVITKDGEE
jgi:hypothetical protein